MNFQLYVIYAFLPAYRSWAFKKPDTQEALANAYHVLGEHELVVNDVLHHQLESDHPCDEHHLEVEPLRKFSGVGSGQITWMMFGMISRSISLASLRKFLYGKMKERETAVRIALVVVERFKRKNKRKLQVLCSEIRLLKAESKDFKAGLK